MLAEYEKCQKTPLNYIRNVGDEEQIYSISEAFPVNIETMPAAQLLVFLRF